MRSPRHLLVGIAAAAVAACSALLSVDDVTYDAEDGGAHDAGMDARARPSAETASEDAIGAPDGGACAPACDASAYCSQGVCSPCIDQNAASCTSDVQCCGYGSPNIYRCVEGGLGARCCKPAGVYCGNSGQCCLGAYCTHEFGGAGSTCVSCREAGAPSEMFSADACAPESCCSNRCAVGSCM